MFNHNDGKQLYQLYQNFVIYVIDDRPHQSRNFSFPLRHVGVNTVVKRSFHPGWINKWLMILLCFTCMKAVPQRKLQWSLNADTAFISASFTNWTNASERFSTHEASMC